jgi:MFS transporter, ACS family, D-galactonate transporter
VNSKDPKTTIREWGTGSPISLRDSPQRWWLTALLVTAMIICYMHRGTLSVAAPLMIKELNLSTSAMGILLSVFFWSYALMQMPAGWLVDRYGVKWSYTLGYAFWSVASTMTGFAHGLVSLISLRIFLGVGQSVAFPTSTRTVALCFRDSERGTVTACYLTGVRLGQALVAAFGAFYLVRGGLQMFFLVTGIIPLLWILLWHRFMGKWEPEPGFNPSKTIGSSSDKRTSFIQSLKLLKQRSVLGIFLGFFAYDYAWYVYVTWLPGYLVMERRFSIREMGIYSSIPYLAMSAIIIVSGLMSDWLIRRGQSEIQVRKVFITLGLTIACLIVPAGFVEDKLTAVWLLTISLCGLGICSPNTWSLTQAVCSKSIVGTVSGIQNFGGNLGGILAPALTGFIAHATKSFSLALGLTGVILVAGVLSYCFLISCKIDNP